ncbi:hypothetical protein Q9966_014707 [Columba livia]|nr:hypothetical protein Q9966_014707 [Columba livia]
MSLVIPEKFQHILRVLNTNIDGRRKIAFAITAIKGVGRRYAHVVLRKADIDLTKRAGELTEDEVERVITIMQNPRQYKIPDWFLNRQKDVKDGKYSQVLANGLDNKLREDLERLKKIRAHRGLRHFWGVEGVVALPGHFELKLEQFGPYRVDYNARRAGRGEPNFDALELNPFRSRRQRQEWEVKALLDKIPAELLTLDPSQLGHVDRAALEQKREERIQRLVPTDPPTPPMTP